MHGTRDPDDSAIVDAFKAGRKDAAFELLVKVYGDKVFRFIRGLVRDPDLAQDVMQDTLFTVYRDLPTLKESAKLASWTYTLARHRAFDALRRHKRHQGPIADHDVGELRDAGALAAAIDVPADVAKGLWRCIDELPPEARAALLLHVLEGYSFVEIGVMLDDKPDAVRMRVNRALRKLRDCCERRGVS